MKWFKLSLLYLLSFIVSISPLLIYFIKNHESYVSTGYDAIKLMSGGVILSFILILKVVKKLKIPSGVVLFSLICVLSYLLAPIIKDLTVLSFLALVGELGDLVVQAFIAREKRKMKAKEVTDIVESAIKGQIGRV